MNIIASYAGTVFTGAVENAALLCGSKIPAERAENAALLRCAA